MNDKLIKISFALIGLVLIFLLIYHWFEYTYLVQPWRKKEVVMWI